MSASFSPRTPRWCVWCRQPVLGRSDKQFCSDACRRMVARHGVPEDTPIDWQARALVAEQAHRALQAQLDAQQQAQQAALAFEQRYDELSQVLGVLVAELRSLGTAANLLDFVTQVLHVYQQHPGLGRGEQVVQQRLQHLRQLQAALQGHYTALQAAQ